MNTSPNLFLEILGWLGQGFFFARFLVQWLASERAKRVVVPTVFWWMSLAGAVCAGIYAFHRGNLVFLAAPVINLFVYGRNLALAHQRQALGQRALFPLVCGIAALAGIALKLKIDEKLAMEDPLAWIIIGSIGQACWIARFPLQWFLSERAGRATLPAAFFWISLVGSVLLLAYAIQTGVPVFIAGMLLGPVLYSRSLVLVYRRPEATARGPAEKAAPTAGPRERS